MGWWYASEALYIFLSKKGHIGRPPGESVPGAYKVSVGQQYIIIK